MQNKKRTLVLQCDSWYNRISYFMEILISAIQKVIIKDIVQYADRKIATTKSVTGQEAVSEGEIS